MRFPVNPTKAGSVFKGWVDGNGNSITKDTIITDNITIKAVWIEPYTCPSNCTPSIDGSICTKVSTKELSTGTGCPSSYSLIDGKCLNISDSVMPDTAYSCSDGTTPVDGLCVNQAREVTSAWDCVGKEYFENGKCIMTQTFTDVCPNSSYTLYDDCQGGGCVRLCIKKTDKISALACPNEYTKDGDICKKTETIKCTAN